MTSRSILPTFGVLHRGQRKDPVDNKRRLALFLSYAPDWVLTILVAGLFFLLDKIEGFKREFSLTDTTIQHTFAVHERVPNVDLFLISVVAPLVLMAIANVISIRSFWDLHVSWLGVILSLALTGSVTNIFKVTVGRPRPDCIDRCQPISGAADHPVFGLVNASICTQTDKVILKDGFRSFPSGHSSLSFAGLGFLSLYLAGKLHLFDERGHTGKAWLSIAPLTGAGLIAISRTMDNRHHWHDVVVGSLLGLALAWFSYRQYYPPLWHPLCHRPYSPRVSRIRPPIPRIHDEDRHDRHDEENDEAEHLHTGSDSHLDGMELHGVVQQRHAEPPSNLREVWREGENDEVRPPGQEQGSSSGSSPLADERV